MAVYTDLSAEDLARLIGAWDVGTLVSAKGIAEGVSNSNWLIETSGSTHGSRFILTMYERRIDLSDLPFFLGLLDDLSAAKLPVPRTIHDRDSAAFRMVDGKAVALIEFLPGVSPGSPSSAQAYATGSVLARLHQTTRNYASERPNDLSPPHCAALMQSFDGGALALIDPDLPQVADNAVSLANQWPQDLPRSIIHSDLFPDNVLMLGNDVSGLIDFYFSCTDFMAYDLAVTHAAWSFGKAGQTYHEDVGAALIEGYESVRTLSADERSAMRILAQGACLRFVASRVEDWLDTPAGALVTRKDPMDFVRRWRFYEKQGNALFA
ncbi:homoserine kinase [Erythrobacter litoralis]|uniref:homoserine kinase n=1 Tax=Erythrobacter litoralis TaxID=39960 RepID=UPI002435A99F|nr:homoserine kinase [Erythrobacter litoralis]MDG6077679.1 homoserine kinase [Erythrobacter litoralis]